MNQHPSSTTEDEAACSMFQALVSSLFVGPHYFQPSMQPARMSSHPPASPEQRERRHGSRIRRHSGSRHHSRHCSESFGSTGFAVGSRERSPRGHQYAHTCPDNLWQLVTPLRRTVQKSSFRAPSNKKIGKGLLAKHGQFRQVLNKEGIDNGGDPERFGSHSFRIGEATEVAMGGESSERIKSLGSHRRRFNKLQHFDIRAFIYSLGDEACKGCRRPQHFIEAMRAKLTDMLRSGRVRGHPFRLEEKNFHLKQRRGFFTVRTVRLWNALPGDVVMADSVNAFKNGLDDFLDRHNIKGYCDTKLYS
ncbi:hypothetical protein XELAEV_18000560mg [Xenopus laevis]|nr:hypothetical protein XELAEV_18000560mg [Xenopus laevis]